MFLAKRGYAECCPGFFSSCTSFKPHKVAAKVHCIGLMARYSPRRRTAATSAVITFFLFLICSLFRRSVEHYNRTEVQVAVENSRSEPRSAAKEESSKPSD